MLAYALDRSSLDERALLGVGGITATYYFGS
jgi:hypothetical protein